ncbi:hypothetical protein NB724_001356 [Pantoea ananatis]|uniref:hypothetical protein n=1 Tax=Pantoea ananas TaxID=553 RepID=UPI0021F6BEB8|nr:hypothetical protein [Pantoea ananatis]MCW0316205.1 hypothetical protein [Pantoea ananatis]MCW0334345.1 hypothetical protein [Pantoea ananatis]MCW0382686.1 hypothetical protein [Pantoea ananatis]MCW0407350.1 hypothetical protein [Pantoea ananatis]MCW0427362.1 hypothetical protein [Pantoea ananatis]
MALFDHKMRSKLEKLINIADTHIRQDFHNGYVIDENDYTSNLTSQIRRVVNAETPLRVRTHSQKLPPSVERRWGADAMIVIIDRKTNLGKVCLFEAKTDRPNWDYPKKKTNYSHFSTQLYRQHKIPSGCAVWEQFYTDKSIHNPPNIIRNKSGSSCIDHVQACNLHHPVPNHTIWTNQDVDQLCLLQKTMKLPITMGGMIRRVCECKYGYPHSIKDIINLFNEKIPVKNIIIIEGSSFGEVEIEYWYADIIFKQFMLD